MTLRARSTGRDFLRSIQKSVRLATIGASVAAIYGSALADRSAEAGVISEWFAAKRMQAPDNASPRADTQTDGRLMSRWMSTSKTPFSSGAYDTSAAVFGEKGWEKTKVAPDPVSEREFAAGKKFFDAKDYAKAEAAFAAIAKREIKKGTPWGEKAQYFLAETQYRRQKYRAASDNYDLLFKNWPGTEYLEKINARQYQIAQIWLADEDPNAKPLPRLAYFDGRAPMIDSHGYAVKILEKVESRDIKRGELADDAALRIADHYHVAGDYESAALYYDRLLNDYPKSPYRERAQLSSIDAKLKGYIGPEYDVSGLDSARETIKRTQNEFPERQAGNEQLLHTLDLIDDQEAERDYTAGMYYVSARKPISAEYQFGRVVAKWPKSKWANLSKNELAKVAKMPRSASLPSKMMTQPGAADPNSFGGAGNGGGGAGGMSGMGGASSAGSGLAAPF